MASEFRYKMTEKARADYEDTIRYIAVELSNPKAAAAFADEFDERVKEAMQFPESGAPANNEYVSNPYVRTKLIGNYIMFYLPDMENKIILVLRIVYGKMDLTGIIGRIDLQS